MKPNHKFRIHIANRNGFGETYCFACMIISSCIVMMFISKVGNFQKMIAINKKKEYERDKILKIVNESLLVLLNNNVESESDSMFDEIWNYNNKVIDDIHINVKTDSGKINFNFCPSEILDIDLLYEDTVLPMEFKDSIKKLKESNIFIISTKDLDESINREEFEKKFTLTSFLNCNFIDFDSIEQILGSKKINEITAREIKEKLQGRCISKNFVCSDAELRMILGIYYEKLCTFLNWKNRINLNFCTREVLETIFNYLGVSISKIDEILQIREKEGLNKFSIEKIYGTSDIKKISSVFSFVNNDYMISFDGNYIRCNVYLKRAFDENIFFVERFEWK